MALYIKDEKIIMLASTKEGIDLIINFIKNKEGEEPTLKKIKEGYLIQTKVRGISNGFSNTVGISKNCKEKSIYVNPTSDIDGNNYCIELHEYIQKLLYILRKNKLNSILS